VREHGRGLDPIPPLEQLTVSRGRSDDRG